MTTVDHSTLLIRASLSPDPDTRATLVNALSRLKAPLDHRLTQVLRFALDYAETTGGPPSPESAGQYSDIVRAFSQPIDSSSILWAVHQINSRMDEDALAAMLLRTLRILKTGDTQNGSGSRKGYVDAVVYLRENTPRIVAPASDADNPDLASEYVAREGGAGVGLLTGFDVLDALTDGVQKTELWMIGAYTGQGKSYFLQNVAYNFRMAGYSGIYWSTENPVRLIKRRLVVRHSLHPKFSIADGLSYTAIKRALLNQTHRERYLNEILPDWDSSIYPPMVIRTVPSRAPLSYLVEESEAIDQQTPLDYMIVDYMSQLRSSRQRLNEREELSELIIEGKQAAMNFGRQRGIALLSAAQTNPTSFLEALKTGRYNIRAVADTAEAERSSDLLMFLLRRPEDIDRGEIQGDVVKYRDGESSVPFTMSADLDRGLIRSKTAIDIEKNQTWTVKL